MKLHHLFEATKKAIGVPAGAKYVAVEIRWYNGGERVDGPFSPESLGIKV